MPRYRLTADAFIAGSRRRKGEIVSHDGPAGRAMEPLPSEPEPEPAPPPARAGGRGKGKAVPAAAGA
ncbi:MAG: hypothetical protein RLZZ501_1645 [Pseudomonadota bacterium]|jgi:hypothetical protein